MLVRLLRYADYFWRVLLSWTILLPLGIAAHIFRLIKRGRILWLICERPDEARDNGYHLFKYIRLNRPDITIKYVISPNSPDLAKISEIGPLIRYGSLKHYFLYAFCHVALSTHLHGVAPKGIASATILALLPKKLTVFLRHGISQPHHKVYRRVLGSNNRNLLMLFGARPEYKYYEKHNVGKAQLKYTGLARFDALNEYAAPKKQVLVMPTFRRWLFDLSRLPKKHQLSEFKKERYFKEFDALIRSPRLQKFLEKNNLNLIFFPHYRIQFLINAFLPSPSPNIVLANREKYDVQELLKESALLVTDYSSVFFDFAYMQRPIIYFQFDRQRYQSRHYKPGYFSYTKHGFGPVAHEVEEVVEAIVNQAETGFELHEQYKKRIDRFFPLRQSENSRRITKAVEAHLKASIL